MTSGSCIEKGANNGGLIGLKVLSMTAKLVVAFLFSFFNSEELMLMLLSPWYAFRDFKIPDTSHQ